MRVSNAGSVFRPARKADLPAIVRMLADDPLGATREQFFDPLPAAYERAFEAIEADPGNQLLVVELDGAVVGCMQLTFIPGLSRLGTTRAQIESVRVDSSARGHGLGEQMIAHAIQLARERGCGIVQLTTDAARANAHRFYERLGFVASHIGMKLDL
jgi:ribosomal protein S18 acetylase RimI-like enzyme